MEKKTYTIIPLAVALVASIFAGIQPDPTHTCVIEETQRYCFDVSGGLHTRCYLTPEKDSWDYCKTGWQPIPEWAKEDGGDVHPVGVQYRCDKVECVVI